MSIVLEHGFLQLDRLGFRPRQLANQTAGSHSTVFLNILDKDFAVRSIVPETAAI